MASAAWMSSVTEPATRFECPVNCCFSSGLGFWRVWGKRRQGAEHQTLASILTLKINRADHGPPNLIPGPLHTTALKHHTAYPGALWVAHYTRVKTVGLYVTHRLVRRMIK